MSKRIVCFGEIMMRLNPESYLRFKYGDYLELPPEGERKTHPVSAIRLIAAEQTPRLEGR